jgi:hypothetical protein
MAFFSSLRVGVEGGLSEDIGYTVTSCGRMKWALLRGLVSSLEVVEFGVGRNLVIRERREGCTTGGRLRIDLPGIGMVTADEEGEHDDEEADISR